jgi:hypothetical protein
MPKQTWRNNDYLYGYDQGAESVRTIKNLIGWARGKGHAKSTILNLIFDMQTLALSDADRGYTDAYLDSVGC